MVFSEGAADRPRLVLEELNGRSASTLSSRLSIPDGVRDLENVTEA